MWLLSGHLAPSVHRAGIQVRCPRCVPWGPAPGLWQACWEHSFPGEPPFAAPRGGCAHLCHPGNPEVATSRAPSARTPNSMKEASLAWTFASPLNRYQVAKADLRICPPPSKESSTPRTSSSSSLFLAFLTFWKLLGILSRSWESDNQTL